MAYVTAEARQELLDAIAQSVDRIAAALAALGDAYEQLDEGSADTLEAELFRPAQVAYGRAKATHTAFAQRHGLRVRVFRPAPSSIVERTAHQRVEAALEAANEADEGLATLQDSLKPIEVGDAELRAGLAEVRRMLDPLPDRARRFVSVLGR